MAFTNFVLVDLLNITVFIFCVVVSQEAWLLGPHTSGFVCAEGSATARNLVQNFWNLN